MMGIKNIAQDTLFGANVSTFAKSSVSTIEQQQSAESLPCSSKG
jgi:hypothetical protein